MRFFLAFALILLAFCGVKAQQVVETPNSPKENLTAVHPKGTWLVGVGGTFIGLTAKGGSFLTERLWLGGELETQSFFTTRREVGVLTRYYVGKGELRAFVGTGVSYGSFKDSWADFDNPMPSIKHYSYKLNVSTGLELQLTKRISVEGVLKVGQLTKVNWTLPTVQGSFNFAFGK